MAPAAGLTDQSAKQYTLTALAATLAVAAIVTVFFVVLCPARVTFSVAHTCFHKSEATGSLQLNLTLAIDNPSRRATVAYKSMFVDLSNSTSAQWENWVRATVTTAMPLRQASGTVVTVGATVDLVGEPLAMAFTGNMTSSFSVMVTAQARFKVGVAWTRLYDIKVSCGPVSFFPGAKAKPGGGGGATAASLPVKCM